MARIDIIIPVFNGFEDTRRCLESVRSSLDDRISHVIVIDDASPDSRIRSYLEETVQADGRITLIRNKTNLGFIKTVNIGMALHPDRDVILLNSDTLVSGDWVERLWACASRSEKNGTVTPFSNNAEIASFPGYLKDNPLVQGFSPEEVDQIFKAANHGMAVDIPTAVGFCMYIKRTCLTDTGFFDENHFGTGYGEENDFCMRAMKKGWRHQLCADTFVYHKGGVSFDAAKAKRIENALMVIDRLHPEYHRIIQAHIKADPERPCRINAMLHLIRNARKSKVLFINHNLGGGTEKHIRDLSSLLKDQIWPILLFPAANGEMVIMPGLERSNDALSFSLPKDYEALLSVLRFIDIKRAHIHQILGLHPLVKTLPNDLSIPYDITLHDYYLINGNPTLIDKEARFCEEKASRDDACRIAYPIPGDLPPQEWRNKQKHLLKGASRIFSPSAFTASIFREYFPDMEITVAFHPDWEKAYPYPSPQKTGLKPEDPFRILVLGALSREKGADTLEACARIAAKENHPFQFHLAGYAYRKLHPSVIQHGAYEDDALPGIIGSIDPHLIWFPATWPETYSYTLSASLKAARPIAAPNLGAFPERLKNRPLTWIKNWKSSPSEWIGPLLSIRRFFIEDALPEGNTHDWKDQPETPCESFRYSTRYLEPDDRELPVDEGAISIDMIKARLFRKEPETGSPPFPVSFRARLVVMLLKLRNHPVSGWLINQIPYRVQQAVKRKIVPVGDPLSSVIVNERFKHSVKK